MADFAARHSGPEALRLYDLGEYFGVVASVMQKLGYRVEIVHSYFPLLTEPTHEELHAWWKKAGLRVHDIDLQTPKLTLPFAIGRFHVVTCWVIEHFRTRRASCSRKPAGFCDRTGF